MMKNIATVLFFAALVVVVGCCYSKRDHRREKQRTYESEAMYTAEMETRNTENYQRRIENNQRNMEIRNQNRHTNDGIYLVK